MPICPPDCLCDSHQACAQLRVRLRAVFVNRCSWCRPACKPHLSRGDQALEQAAADAIAQGCTQQQAGRHGKEGFSAWAGKGRG